MPMRAWKQCGGWTAFFEQLAWLREAELVREKAERVQILTLHASKGLEFQAVFIPGLEDGLLPFKSGIYHLARQRPELEFVPVWIDNLKRVMPKGRFLPLPLLCTASFGAPLRLQAGEDKAAFLARSRQALLALAPEGARA